MADQQYWDRGHLLEHLQFAADLEFWTISYYLTALYSLKNPGCDSYKLIQSVCFQEMLHVQLVCNISNALGYSPTISAPTHNGKDVPHLDFTLDGDHPLESYPNHTAELGPLDQQRLETMCLVEHPEWEGVATVSLLQRTKDYPNIGHFYSALRYAIEQHVDEIKGNQRQIELFRNYYPALGDDIDFTISRSGEAGFKQIVALIDVICEQGEGASSQAGIPKNLRNTIDDQFAELDHYQKFQRVVSIPTSERECYAGVATPQEGSAGRKAQITCAKQFALFCSELTLIVKGDKPLDEFGRVMAHTGAAMANCWKQGAVPVVRERV